MSPAADRGEGCQRVRLAAAEDARRERRRADRDPAAGIHDRGRTGELDAEQFACSRAEARARANAGRVRGSVDDVRGGAFALARARAVGGRARVGRAATRSSDSTRRRVVALMDRIDCELALGRHDDLVGELEVLVARASACASACTRSRCSRSTGRAGRRMRSAPTSRAREVLVEELGLEPSPALQRLERGILNHDPSLQTPRGTAHRNGDAPSRPRRVRRRRPGRVGVACCVLLGGLAAALAWRGGRQWPWWVAAGSRGDRRRETRRRRAGRRLRRAADLESPIALRGVRPTATASDGERLWLVAADGTLTRFRRGVARDRDLRRRCDRRSRSRRRVGLGHRPGRRQGHPHRPRVVGKSSTGSAVGNGPSAIAFAPSRERSGSSTAPTGPSPGSTAARQGDGEAASRRAPVRLRWRSGPARFGSTDEQLGTVTRIDRANEPAGCASDRRRSNAGLDRLRRWLGLGRGRAGRGPRIDPAPIASSPRPRWARASTRSRSSPRRSGRKRPHGQALRGSTRGTGASSVPLPRLGGALVVARAHVGSQVAVTAVRAPATPPRRNADRRRRRSPEVRARQARPRDVVRFATGGCCSARRMTGSSGSGAPAASAGSRIVPDLARSLPLVDTAETTYTFVLRPGLRYSSGRPVPGERRPRVDRAVWRIRRLATPKEPKGGSLLTDNPDLRLGLVGEGACAARPRQLRSARRGSSPMT